MGLPIQLTIFIGAASLAALAGGIASFFMDLDYTSIAPDQSSPVPFCPPPLTQEAQQAIHTFQCWNWAALSNDDKEALYKTAQVGNVLIILMFGFFSGGVALAYVGYDLYVLQVDDESLSPLQQLKDEIDVFFGYVKRPYNWIVEKCNCNGCGKYFLILVIWPFCVVFAAGRILMHAVLLVVNPFIYVCGKRANDSCVTKVHQVGGVALNLFLALLGLLITTVLVVVVVRGRTPILDTASMCTCTYEWVSALSFSFYLVFGIAVLKELSLFWNFYKACTGYRQYYLITISYAVPMVEAKKHAPDSVGDYLYDNDNPVPGDETKPDDTELPEV